MNIYLRCIRTYISDSHHINYNLKLQMSVIITIINDFPKLITCFYLPLFPRALYSFSTKIQNELVLFFPVACSTLVCSFVICSIFCIMMFLKNLINYIIVILYNFQENYTYYTAIGKHYKLRHLCLCIIEISAPLFTNHLPSTACVTDIKSTKSP